MKSYEVGKEEECELMGSEQIRQKCQFVLVVSACPGKLVGVGKVKKMIQETKGQIVEVFNVRKVTIAEALTLSTSLDFGC